MSDSLWLHGLQHPRLPCPSPSPRVCSSSCPLSWWCHPTISSCVTPSPSLNRSQHQGLFQWVGSLHHVAQSIRASASVLPVTIQGWFPLELTEISLPFPDDNLVKPIKILKTPMCFHPADTLQGIGDILIRYKLKLVWMKFVTVSLTKRKSWRWMQKMFVASTLRNVR